jgi:hypothetical protein
LQLKVLHLHVAQILLIDVGLGWLFCALPTVLCTLIVIVSVLLFLLDCGRELGTATALRLRVPSQEFVLSDEELVLVALNISVLNPRF